MLSKLRTKKITLFGKTILALIAGLLLIQNAFALQQVAGALVIPVPIGGSNSARYGLMNDGNETITVSLRAEGDVAKYLSFPATVDLPSKKVIYTNVTATMPADYDVSLGRNITGYLYALQEGKSSGQVQINVQMMKSVTIVVSGQSNEQLKSDKSNQASPITGLVSLISANSLVIVLIVVLVVIALILIKIKGKEVKKNEGNYRNSNSFSNNINGS